MSELRDVLEGIRRQVRARPDALERVHSRFRRRERNRRVTAGAVAVLVAIVGTFAALQLIGVGERTGPASPPIDQTNVSRLAPSWSRQLDGAGASAPVVADGVLYVASDSGNLFALDARSGRTLWVGELPLGTVTAPVVADGSVLVEAAGSLLAFDAGCAQGGETCSPRWVARTGGANLASPSVTDGVVYVVSSPGGLSAFPLGCSDPCNASWTAPDAHGHVAFSPTVAGGLVWDSSSHALAALPTSCSDPCTPLVRDVHPRDVELSSGPAAADSTVYVGANDGRVYAVPASCARGETCAPRWSGRTSGGIVATPVVAGGLVFVGSTDGRVYAFPVACGRMSSRCRPSWVGEVGGAIDQPPVVSGGLVYVSSEDGTLSIFKEFCPARACAPIQALAIGALPPAPSVWADRVIYTSSADGEITAYSVDGMKI